jgi:hypothetical protein
MEKNESFSKAFLDILVEQKVISPDRVSEISRRFADSSIQEFDAFLLEEGLADVEQILIALGMFYHVSYFDAEGHFFETFLLRKFPKDFLIRHAIIPLATEGDFMMVVAAHPEAVGLESAMRNYVSYDIEFLVGIRRHIVDAIEEYYDRSLVEDAENTEMHEHELGERDVFEVLEENDDEDDV